MAAIRHLGFVWGIYAQALVAMPKKTL